MSNELQPELAVFFRKLMRLTRGRIDILRALAVIRTESEGGYFADALDDIEGSVRSGTTLSEALAAQPALFSLSVVELVRSAERTGAWDDILLEIADGLQEGTFR